MKNFKLASFRGGDFPLNTSVGIGGGGAGCAADEGPHGSVGGYKAHDYLREGHLQVGVHIDTLIYHLLHSHCCTQARQAEILIETSLAHVSSISPNTELGPPLIFASSMRRPTQPHLSSLYLNIQTTGPQGALAGSVKSTSSSSIGSEKSVKDIGENTPFREASPPRDQQKGAELSPAVLKAGSGTASLPTSSRGNSSDSGFPSSGGPDEMHQWCSTPPSSGPASAKPAPPPTLDGSAPKPTSSLPLRNPSIKKVMSEDKRARKTSVVSMRTHSSTKSSDSEDDGMLDGRGGRHGTIGGGGGGDTWHVYSPDPKDLIIATYGDNSYPLVMWDPTLKVEFKLSSSLGILSGSVIAIEPSKPTVTIKVKNTTAMEIGFSVRAYRQTVVQKTHIVYPTQGLHKMDPYDHWEDNTDFMSSENQEFFVLDLFVCTLTGLPAWNVIRKYAVMKAVNKSSNTLTVSKPRKFTHFQLPGTSDTKEQNLKLVIAQGLQCVIKDKLGPAEIIFTQAMQLPDFQRLPLLAYVHICLAVIANKKTKERHSLQPMIAHSNCVTKLLDICDSSPAHVKMPKMIMLVKQLKKELNLEKLIKETQKREKRMRLQKSNNTSLDLGSTGGSLLGEGVTLDIPPEALQQEVKITVATTDMRQLQSMLCSKGWDQTVSIVTALEVHCTPPIEQFERPVEISAIVPAHHVPLLLGNPQLCLMHSKYMRHWQDITTESSSSIKVIKDNDGGGGGGSGTRIRIQTDHLGFLAVTWVNLDPFKIAQIAMRSLVAEPVVIQISSSAELFLDDNAAQLVVSIQPCKPHGEPLVPSSIKLQDHTPISFPHTVQAYVGEKLRLSLAGHFEAHEGYGETDLNFACDVSASINQMFEKWVRLQTGKPLTGKLLVSCCRGPPGGQGGGGPASYEVLTEINISTRTGMRCSSSSST
eukprot:Em0001g1488a